MNPLIFQIHFRSFLHPTLQKPPPKGAPKPSSTSGQRRHRRKAAELLPRHELRHEVVHGLIHCARMVWGWGCSASEGEAALGQLFLRTPSLSTTKHARTSSARGLACTDCTLGPNGGSQRWTGIYLGAVTCNLSYNSGYNTRRS